MHTECHAAYIMLITGVIIQRRLSTALYRTYGMRAPHRQYTYLLTSRSANGTYRQGSQSAYLPMEETKKTT